eukprot:scaffold2724_cov193-Amphora_coffeaeformis.AAC.4
MTMQLIVKAGSCMNGGDGRVCAFQPMDCPTGTSFVTPRMLEQGGGGTAHGGACAAKEGTENVAKIGSCMDGTKGFCASDASLCADPQAFVPVDDRCTIRVDRLKQTSSIDSTTLFGKCIADNTCYWSQNDCADPSSWKVPNDSENTDHDCTCEQVRVGACVDAKGFYYCAVSKEACSSVGTWIDASSLMRSSNSDAPDCFLCRQDNVAPIQGTTSNNPSSNEGSLNDVTIINKGGGTANKTAIVGGVVAGGGMILILMFVMMLYRRQRMVGPSKQTVSDIPVETITDMSANNQDIEELSTDGGI